MVHIEGKGRPLHHCTSWMSHHTTLAFSDHVYYAWIPDLRLTAPEPQHPRVILRGGFCPPPESYAAAGEALR
jgi:hypothetical protein